MGLKSDLTSERAAHGTEMQSLGIELDSERCVCGGGGLGLVHC